MSNQRRGRRSRKRRKSAPGNEIGTLAQDRGRSDLAASKPAAKDDSKQARLTQAQRTQAKHRQPRERASDRPGLPQSPWHPLPLSELLILAGGIGTVIGLRRGPLTHGRAPLLAGIIAVTLGTIEVMLREHLGGYRSHTILLALFPVALLHSVVVLCVSAFTTPSTALNVAMLAVDLILFLVLFRLMRTRFIDSRRSRLFKGRR